MIQTSRARLYEIEIACDASEPPEAIVLPRDARPTGAALRRASALRASRSGSESSPRRFVRRPTEHPRGASGWIFVEATAAAECPASPSLPPRPRLYTWDEVVVADADPVASLADALARHVPLAAWRAEWATHDDPLPTAWERCADPIAMAEILAHVAPRELQKALEMMRHRERLRDCIAWWTLFTARESLVDGEIDVSTRLLRSLYEQCTCGQVPLDLAPEIRVHVPTLTLAAVQAAMAGQA